MAKLQAKLSVATKRAKKKSGRKVKISEITSEEGEYRLQLTDACKDALWHAMKFCNSSKKLDNLTRAVMHYMQPDQFEGLQGKALEKAEAKFIADNSNLVRQCLNQIRSYFLGQVRAEWVKCKNSSKNCMSVQQMWDCVTREEYIFNTKEARELFAKYVDVWLFKIVGKHHWDKHIRHNQTVSLAEHHDSDQNKACINPGTEAFLFLVYEGGQSKWPYNVECKQMGKNFSQKHDATRHCPWMVSDGGQMEWGGCTNAAREHWKELKEKCKQACERNHVKAGEALVLKEMQISLGLDKADSEVEDSKKKATKRCYDCNSDDNDDEFADYFR